MALFEQISADIKKAMLARNKVELEALRGIKKELLEAKTSKENAGELTDAVAIKVIQKMAREVRRQMDKYGYDEDEAIMEVMSEMQVKIA